MLSLSANSDYVKRGHLKKESEYYDWDGYFEARELVGKQVLDQSIEMVLVTEPQERLFNLSFGSPLYMALFENFSSLNEIMDEVYNRIEYWVPIQIDRSNTKVEKDEDNHAISFQIPYVANNGEVAGVFSRRIRA